METPTAARRRTARPRQKTAYHHGDLRQALVTAAQRLIGEHGPEGFTLADACRLAGVSTAAPYRHFTDRAALVAAVATEGFAELAARIRAAMEAHPAGSEQGIVAMGQAYVRFAADRPAVFKLMFGRHPAVQHDHKAPPEGGACFGVLAEATHAWMARVDMEGRSYLDVALPLWTIVHGVSYLLIDNDLAAVAPGSDAYHLVAETTLATLSGLAATSQVDPA